MYFYVENIFVVFIVVVVKVACVVSIPCMFQYYHLFFFSFACLSLPLLYFCLSLLPLPLYFSCIPVCKIGLFLFISFEFVFYHRRFFYVVLLIFFFLYSLRRATQHCMVLRFRASSQWNVFFSVICSFGVCCCMSPA